VVLFSKALMVGLMGSHSPNGYGSGRGNYQEKSPSWSSVAPSPTLDAEVEKLVRLGYDRDTAVVMVAALVEKEETDRTIPVAPSQRVGGVFMGIFLMTFGLPFIILPATIWTEVGNSGGLDLLLICFPIPFIMAGGFVMFMGGNILIMALKGEAPAGPSWSDDDGSSYLPAPEQRPVANIGAYDSSAFPSMDDIVGQQQEDLLPDFPDDAPVEETVAEDAGSFWGNINEKGNTE
tara:strand:+ start:1091 stop:1792 length:702 start_codon:yes stop_codon:yes gene_type:complete